MKELRKYAQEGPQLFPDGTDDRSAGAAGDGGDPAGEAAAVPGQGDPPRHGGGDHQVLRAGQRCHRRGRTIYCEKASHKGIIIGKQGAMLKKIGSNARYELEQMLEQKVNLKLWVKVKKDWRDSDFLVKNFGYDKKKLDL